MNPIGTLRTLVVPLLFISAMLNAQTPPPGVPVIPRSCLWNTDARLWKKLGADRATRERLRELRERYPAVVEGQWITSEDSLQADRAEPSTSLNNLRRGDPVPGTTADQGSGPGANAPMEPRSPSRPGLQAELRALLTTEQLVAWSRMCGQ